MAGGSDVIQGRELLSVPGLKKPLDPGLTIKGEFKEKLLLVALMSSVPDVSW